MIEPLPYFSNNSLLLRDHSGGNMSSNRVSVISWFQWLETHHPQGYACATQVVLHLAEHDRMAFLRLKDRVHLEFLAAYIKENAERNAAVTDRSLLTSNNLLAVIAL